MRFYDDSLCYLCSYARYLWQTVLLFTAVELLLIPVYTSRSLHDGFIVTVSCLHLQTAQKRIRASCWVRRSLRTPSIDSSGRRTSSSRIIRRSATSHGTRSVKVALNVGQSTDQLRVSEKSKLPKRVVNWIGKFVMWTNVAAWMLVRMNCGLLLFGGSCR